jgi:hypothetical protein
MLCKASDEQGLVVKLEMSLLTANASTTEEPREGKLHAGICAGGVRQLTFLP